MCECATFFFSFSNLKCDSDALDEIRSFNSFGSRGLFVLCWRSRRWKGGALHVVLQIIYSQEVLTRKWWHVIERRCLFNQVVGVDARHIVLFNWGNVDFSRSTRFFAKSCLLFSQGEDCFRYLLFYTVFSFPMNILWEYFYSNFGRCIKKGRGMLFFACIERHWNQWQMHLEKCYFMKN